MAGDLDEHDLYPPDAEHLTPEAKSQRFRAAVGSTLVVWGTALLIERVLRVDIEAGMLGLGIGALVGWMQLRTYPWFVAGAIMTGIGAGDFVTHVMDGAIASSISSMLVAGGFFAIFARYPFRSKWALVPAGVMAVISVGALGIGLIGLIPGGVGHSLLPLLLIAGGALLLFRHAIPKKKLCVGLAIVGGTFVLVGMSNVGDANDFGFGSPMGRAGSNNRRSVSLPPLDGKTLVIQGGEADIEIRQTSGPGGVILDSDEYISVATIGDEVKVKLTSRGGGSGAYVFAVPPRTDVNVQSGDGDIDAMLQGGDAALRTGEGSVTLRLLQSEFDGRYSIETGDGEIVVATDEEAGLDITSGDGEIDVYGEEYENRFQKPVETGPKVTIHTGEGDVIINRPAVAA